MKQCHSCKRMLALDCFSTIANGHGRYGLHGTCKRCIQSRRHPAPLKQCAHCQRYRPDDEFMKRKTDGERIRYCDSCVRATLLASGKLTLR